MNPKTLGLPLACLALGALAFGRPQQATPKQERPLASAIPEDVFLYTHARHNPERAFLEAHWNKVWETFLASGIVDDLSDLVLGAMDEDQQAVVQHLHERFGALIGAVDWSGLVGGETAFGERMPPLRFLGKGKDGVVATPDYVVLFRPGPEADGDAIHAGIEALVDALVDEVHTMTGVELGLERRQEGKVSLLVLDGGKSLPPEAGIALGLGRSGDIHFLTFGSAMLDDVVGLLNGRGDLHSVDSSARLHAAVKLLPEAEDALTYFDMQNLRSNLGAIFDGVFEKVASESVADEITNSGANAEAVALRRKGLEVYQQGDYGEAMRLMQASLEVDPADSSTIYDIACLHALMGAPDQALDWLEKSVQAGFHAPHQIATDDDLRTLRKEPRFAAAMERARAEASKGSQGELTLARGVASRVLDLLGILDCSATVTSTDGYSTYTESVAILTPGAEKNPLYPILTSGVTPMDDFARWLPRETTDFTLDAGISVQKAYAFVEDFVRQIGPPGEAAWKKWEEVQLEMDFDLNEDLLSWIGPASVHASVDLDGQRGWFMLMQVLDEGKADDSVEWVLELAQDKIDELSGQIPQLAFIKPNVSPTTHPELEGFHNVAFGMMPKPMVLGVHDGWLMMGSTQDALLAALHTAKGEHESVRANETLMAKAMLPRGPFQTMSFADHRGDAQEVATVLGSVAMMGGMAVAQIPEPEKREVATRLLGMVGKLAPVIGSIDFFDSSSAVTQFDGKAWHTRKVTHYVPPAPAEGEGEGGL